MSKTLFILFFLLLHGYFCTAQDNDGDKDIEAVRMAYITNQLKLSPEEAQKFWPIYNSYIQEIKKARKENQNDVISQQEKIVSINKKYKDDFKKVVGSDDRVNKAFKAEGDFRKILKDEWQKRHPNANKKESVQDAGQRKRN